MFTVDVKQQCNNATPDRRKQKQLCHINILKEYVDRNGSNVAPVNVISSVPQKQSEMNCEEVDCEETNFHKTDPTCSKLLLCSHFPNDVPPEPQRNVSLAAVRGAVRPSTAQNSRILTF